MGGNCGLGGDMWMGEWSDCGGGGGEAGWFCGDADGETETLTISFPTVAAEFTRVRAEEFTSIWVDIAMSLTALAFLGGCLGLVGTTEVEACFSAFRDFPMGCISSASSSSLVGVRIIFLNLFFLGSYLITITAYGLFAAMDEQLEQVI